MKTRTLSTQKPATWRPIEQVYGLCECCEKQLATQRHHKFSQTKWARKLYGEVLDYSPNIQMVCADFHVSHASTKLEHWTEKKFCERFDILPKSKARA